MRSFARIRQSPDSRESFQVPELKPFFCESRFGGAKHCSGKSKRGLSKGGLSPKGANRAKKGPFGAISALHPWVWGAEELVPIGPEKAPTSPEMAPICPEKARFSRKDFPPIFSENLGLKPPFVSPPLDFPKLRIAGLRRFARIARTLNENRDFGANRFARIARRFALRSAGPSKSQRLCSAPQQNVRAADRLFCYKKFGGLSWCCEKLPKGPCHTKNTTVIVIHYDGSKTLRRQQNATAGSLKHLVFQGKPHRKSPQKANYYGDSKLP